MSKRTVIHLEDDLTGGVATQTVTFGLANSMYEIDLNEENAAQLSAALEPFIGAARKAGFSGGTSNANGRSGGARRGSGRPTLLREKGFNPDSVRAWANRNGYTVSDRGRIPDEVVRKFDQATAGGTNLEDKPQEKATPARSRRSTAKAEQKQLADASA